jgi:hypothetical protein
MKAKFDIFSLQTLLLAALMPAGTLQVRAADDFRIDRYTVAGGGPAIGDSQFGVSATAGQAEASALGDSSFWLQGGFWAGSAGGGGWVTISPTSWSLMATAGTQSVTLTASDPNVIWNVNNPCPSWLAVSPMSGVGSGSVIVTAQTNASCSPRFCNLTIGGNTFTVNQAGNTTFALDRYSIGCNAAGVYQPVTVTASDSNCVWSVNNPCSDWVTVTPTNGTGSGLLSVWIHPTTDCSGRWCNLTIAGNNFGVTQTGTAGFTLDSTVWNAESSGGTRVVTLTAGNTNCPWRVDDSCSSWLTVSPTSGTGNCALTLTAQPNTSCSGRSCNFGLLEIAGITFVVNQAGSPFTINLTNWSPAASGGSQNVTVTNPAANCNWYAFTYVPWLTVVPTSGTGNATVTVTAQVNTNCSPRTSPVNIAGNWLYVTQAGGSGSFTILWTNRNFAGSGGTMMPWNSVPVYASDPDCPWTVTIPCASWVTADPMSGTGSSDVTVSVQANPSCTSNRSCTLTIAGNAFTVNQAVGGTFTIDRTNWIVPLAGGHLQVALTASCTNGTWEADDPCYTWVSATPNSGTGSGTIFLAAEANTTCSNRSCKLTLAGTTFYVNQPGCTISTNKWTAPVGGGIRSVWVTPGSSNCAWTIVNPCPSWVTGPAGGTGNMGATLTARPNTNCCARSCTLTIAGNDFTVTQPGAGTITLSPLGWNPSASGGSQPVLVTASTNCFWSVSNSCASWLTVSPMSGIGTNQVTVTAQSNPNCLARSCTLTIGGTDFVVNQAAAVGPAITTFYNRQAGFVTLTWPGGGVLQQADSLLGPWADAPPPNNTSPFSTQTTAPQRFYRVRCN